MIKTFRNFTYFIEEALTIFKLNGLSGFLSMLSLALIFFVTALTLTGWWTSTALMTAIQEEAEINAYFPESLNVYAEETLRSEIETLEGVKSVKLISAEVAYNRMSEVLGQEAKILEQFGENPFVAYYEVSIELERLDEIVEKLSEIKELEYVRDNRSVLEQIGKVATVVGILGLIMTFAVGAATVIITSHIIREGVHNHKDQINTLELLGAPDRFIRIPFLIEGTVLTGISGVIAAAVYGLFMLQIQNVIAELSTFLPRVQMGHATGIVILGLLIGAIILGGIGSYFGLKLVKQK